VNEPNNPNNCIRDLTMADSVVEHWAPSDAGTARECQLTVADTKGESIGDWVEN
jgi:hypothetical protein